MALALLAAVACSGTKQAPPNDHKPFRVALIANGPLTDYGFNQAQKESLDDAKKLLGDRVDVQSVGDVPETGDAERIARRLIAERADLLIAASFGYQDTSVKLATEFPNLKILQAWGFKPAQNLGTYSSKMYEAWYVMGIVAGRMTKTGKLGIVAAHPIPPMRWQINAYVLGARSVNPNVTASVAFINHWFDPGLATEATETLINQGADVVTGILDNSVAVARTAERRNVMLIGHNADLSSFAPTAILVGTKWQWGRLYASAIEKILQGTWKGTDGDLNGGFREGYVGITGFGSRVPDDVKRQAEEAVARFTRGDLAVYRGPIKDNTGREVVPSGVELTHDQIMAIDWAVEGVR
ncbi:MAG: BMP family ABC transporter substrate-binding protein [Vicinamibacterales bacterium]